MDKKIDDLVVDLIKDKWSIAEEPVISRLIDVKSTDYENFDYVLVFLAEERDSFMAIGGREFRRTASIEITVGSKDYTRAWNEKEEVIRIFREKTSWIDFYIARVGAARQKAGERLIWTYTIGVEVDFIEDIGEG